jgi:protein Tex
MTLLSLRLDDETNNSKKEAKGSSKDNPGNSAKASPPRKSETQSGGGALAEALRRASEKGDRGKTGR